MLFPDCPDFSYGCECRYFGSGAMPGSGRGSKIINKLKKNGKIGVCLIVLGVPSLGILYGYFTKGVRKREDT